jgi:hypothetical protein
LLSALKADGTAASSSNFPDLDRRTTRCPVIGANHPQFETPLGQVMAFTLRFPKPTGRIRGSFRNR